MDLHVLPPLSDLQSCERMAEVLHTVGYSVVGLTVPTGILRDRLKAIRQIFERNRNETALRVDLTPGSRLELLRALRTFRNSYDIIAVKCKNQRVATVACRDRRVDMIFFDLADRNARFTHTYARLLRGAIEFNLADILRQSERWAVSGARKAIAIAREHHVSMVVSSGATVPFMVSSPTQISALINVLGATREESAAAVASTPLAFVAQNRMKRAPEYVEEGVKIVVPARR